ncbi:MAG: orotidine-5'-phosphate decarboxylase [Candidatus Paceibacterota bacterium]
MAESKICLALEGLSLERACSLTSKLGMYCYAVKIHDLHDAEGPNAIRVLKKVGAKRVWVDAKLHDTPDTVALRMRALTRNGADIITVHASGGIKMMEAAAAAALYAGGDILTEIWAITLLTSLGPTEIERDFGKYGRNPTAEQIVLNRALMAREGGLNGLVCSAKEVGMLSSHHDLQGMTFTVPGTRSAGVALGQQKRSGTPAQAISDGATFIVASSQVVKAEHPVMAFKAMAAEVGMQI